jgi:flagellar hook protein FlgE
MSFDIALSGIQAINEQLESTSNNIANAGTYGFKSSRANFASMYSGSQPTGVEVGSHTQSIGQTGGVLNTGRALDAAINGRGFFVGKDAQGTLNYSRVGIFTVSKDGYLVDSANRRTQGYAPVVGSAALGAMGDIKVPTGQIPAVATTSMNYIGNLSSDWTVPGNTFDSTDATSYNMSKVSVAYDSIGTKHTVTQYFVKTAAGVDVNYLYDGAPPAAPATAAGTISLTFAADGQLATVNGNTPTNAAVAPATNPPGWTPTFAPVTLATLTLTPTANNLAPTLDYTGTTGFSGESVTSTNSADGYASGTFIGVELTSNGSLLAKYTNGEKQVVGTVALATFPDEDALTSVSDTSWVASIGSGTPLYDTPGSGMAGALSTSSLEQSNVDITSELVGLMTSQRNYQANSKVISTESAMLQSLMQAL